MNLKEKCIKNNKESTTSGNLLQCDFPINFDDSDILASDFNKFLSYLERKVYFSNVSLKNGKIISARSFELGIYHLLFMKNTISSRYLTVKKVI